MRRKPDPYTTIRIPKALHRRLAERVRFGHSLGDVIAGLLDEASKCKAPRPPAVPP